MIFVLISTLAAVVSAFAAVLAAIPPFAEYLRSCRSRRDVIVGLRRRQRVLVHNSTGLRGPVLGCTVAEWRAFIGGGRDGGFDGFGRADWSNRARRAMPTARASRWPTNRRLGIVELRSVTNSRYDQFAGVATGRSARRILTRVCTARTATVMPMMAPMTEPVITTSHRPALMPTLCWNSSVISPIAKPAP